MIPMRYGAAVVLKSILAVQDAPRTGATGKV
jgi:hypothetical protein